VARDSFLLQQNGYGGRYGRGILYIVNRWSAKANEVAHIDLIIGSKSGPTGAAFVMRSLARQTAFKSSLAS